MLWRTLMSTEKSKMTPIVKLTDDSTNNLYVKREDFIPYSFGGNKARKAYYFFEEIDNGGYDYVVTYGSSHSNHCRVIANMAAARGIPCLIISPTEVSETTYNSILMEVFGASIITVPVEEVHDTIEKELERLRTEGYNPYFIQGGGHGNLGTGAYVDCYDEIKQFEQQENLHFDYIFFASGTGTTHAGLVCGQLFAGDDRKIVGISIARKNPRGRDVVLGSIRDFLSEEKRYFSEEEIQEKTVFLDDYISDGYGKSDEGVSEVIKKQMILNGMPLDSTYTGKAFYGMKEYIKAKGLQDKNILFIHTGGTPLFFDDLNQMGGK